MVGDVHRNAVAVPHGTQLFERLGHLNRRLRQFGELTQKADAVAIQAHMAQRRGTWECGDTLRKSITPPSNGGSAEIQRCVAGIEHHLHHIGVGKVFHALNGVGEGAHAAVAACLQQQGGSVNRGGVNQGLVALHVHHHIAVLQLQQIAGFGQTVAARRVVGASEDGIDAVSLARSHDALVTVEEGCTMGGAGSAVLEALQAAELVLPVLQLLRAVLVALQF